MNKYLSLFFLPFLIYSCKYKTDNFALKESEFYIDDKTASITSDELGQIWIGTENGSIYRYNNKKLLRYDLRQDRIYKAALHVSHKNDTLLWVASRNAGLQVWNIDDWENPKKIRTYTIEVSGKNYSPYDFVFTGQDIYVSTTLGFYKGEIENPDKDMELLYPSNPTFTLSPSLSCICESRLIIRVAAVTYRFLFS